MSIPASRPSSVWLRGLAPAENLSAVDRELQQLSQKIDVLAHNSQDPAALRQLDGAIGSLRGIVSQVASNDALASLSDEVRALAGKVDQATAGPGSNNVLNALEERIAALADALAARNEVGERVLSLRWRARLLEPQVGCFDDVPETPTKVIAMLRPQGGEIRLP